MQTILVTGSAGLIGTALSAALKAREQPVFSIDVRGTPDLRLDIRDPPPCSARMDCVSGIVHLAAISRVVEGERNPNLCWSVNVEGTRAVIELAAKLPLRPWIIYASSREVYGEHAELPVVEDADLKPLNVYARSKVAAENLISEARDGGIAASILRFSNVYGSIHDHLDRVVPAFASAAAFGGTLRVDNRSALLDFTHVSDVVDGVLKLIDRLEERKPPPPPIHLVTGVPTSLDQLASLAIKLGDASTSVSYAMPRSYDVQRFYGNPSRAAQLLAWRPLVEMPRGFAHLVDEFKSATFGAS